MSKLVDFLVDNNVFFRESGDSTVLECPRCNKFKLTIHKSEHNFICFYCAATDPEMKGPNASVILEQITGHPKAIIRNKLSNFIALKEFNPRFQSDIVSQKPLIPEIAKFSFPPTTYHINTNIAIPGKAYLESRGITHEVASFLDIRFDVKYKSVIFPIYHNKEIVGYQGRSIDPDCPKQYQKITMKGFKKANYLMFEQTLSGPNVILAEGPISAMKFAKSGIGFVATMGKYVSEQQMDLLKEKGIKTVYLALDEDAFLETEALMRQYSNDFEFKLVLLPDRARVRLSDLKKPDFGDCTFDECNQAILESIPFNNMTAFSLKVNRALNASTSR